MVNPTDRRIEALMVEQRRPFDSVWDGEEELVHVVRDAFVTVPPLAPGGSVTLRFTPADDGGTDPPQARATRGSWSWTPATTRARAETRIVVSVCRRSGWRVEGIDPDGVYRVQVDDEPALDLMPRTVRTIQALLSKQSTGDAIRTRRTKTPGVTTFLEVPIAGDDTDSSSAPSASRCYRPPMRTRLGRRFWPLSPPAPGV